MIAIAHDVCNTQELLPGGQCDFGRLALYKFVESLDLTMISLIRNLIHRSPIGCSRNW